MNLLSLPVVLVATLSTPVPAGDASLDWQIPMEPHAGYYVQQCLSLEAGEILDYRVRSPHPVDFNINYRDNQDILYPIRINHMTRHDGRVQARIDGRYCFMWINNERQQTGYRIRLILERESTG